MKSIPALLCFVCLSLLSAAVPAQQADGEAVYQARCAACHTDPQEGSHAPSREDMARFTPNSVYAALTDGVMQLQAVGLSDRQMRAVSSFLTGSEVSEIQLQITSNLCQHNPPMEPLQLESGWNGWGPDARNTRYQGQRDSAIDGDTIGRLRLKWAYGLPGESQPRAQPAVAGGRLFVGNRAGGLYALDAETGCTYWSYLPRSGIRSALSVGPVRLPDGEAGYAVYFVDIQGTAYAVDAHSGEQLWSTQVDEQPTVRGTGAVKLHDGRLYVPMTGVSEENTAADPDYPCCTFRGSITALDANTGERIWKYYTVPEPQPRGKSSSGVQLYGPAGVGVWSSPTIDADRGLLYAATGNAYAEPAPETADAVIALDLDTGELRWVRQMTPGDAWIGGCEEDDPNPNCPDELGPDYDFSASPALTATSTGRELLVVPQKSGIVYALDPNDGGKLVWQYEAYTGSPVGGVWGVATGQGLAYFSEGGYFREDAGGVHAIDLASGERVWYTPPQPLLCEEGAGCSSTQSAAVTAVPGAVFSGSADGGMRAYAADDGEILWTFDANRDFDAINGVDANGASFDGPGPVVAGDMLYMLSGNAGFVGRPGNVLLAFELEGGEASDDSPGDAERASQPGQGEPGE